LFPPPVVRDPTADIFNQWTVSLGAYLLAQFPECDTEKLGVWIANYPEIERRVQGTIHQYTLPANSPQQRAGVLGTLALAGDPLWMMPTASEGRDEFCIRLWCQDPKGWVFISSDSDTRDSLKPLISMWMDLFILGLLSSNTKKRTKLVYDELHTLQTLTRLHDGITMLRSAGHQIIASIQNQEQLKHLYGDQAGTILSQAYTKWLFATSHPDSADILERIGGKRKLLRLEETHSQGATFFDRDRNSSRIVQVEEPAISSTQIKGMGDLCAYFVQRGFKRNRMVIVPVEIPYINLPEKHPAFLERMIPQREFSLPPDVRNLAAPVDAETRAALTEIVNAPRLSEDWKKRAIETEPEPIVQPAAEKTQPSADTNVIEMPSGKKMKIPHKVVFSKKSSPKKKTRKAASKPAGKTSKKNKEPAGAID
jgi:Type IV secretion-system coupling protein DNA-binding domain